MEQKYKEIKEIAQQIADVMQSKKIENEDALKSWIVNDSTSKGLVDVFSNEEKLTAELKSFDKRDLCNVSVDNLKRRMIKSRRMKIVRVTSIAVALIAISMLVWTNVIDNVKVAEKEIVATHVNQMNVNAPTLVLGNGVNVDLEKVNGNIEGATIIKSDKSLLKYTELTNNTKVNKLNTLIIPSKFTYSVELSDGTKVMLNANSKLIYPVVFDKDKREVTLEGEAFFEVSKSAIPFVVNVKGVSVRVYGTKFNVNCYNSNIVETVLVSGSVGVSILNRKDLLEQILKPNQLSNVNLIKGSNRIVDVDAESYIAWVNGSLKSYDSTLGNLIEKLSYWYGVDFKFAEQEKYNIPITASFKRDQPIEKIISAIEYASNVKIQKEKGGYVIN